MALGCMLACERPDLSRSSTAERNSAVIPGALRRCDWMVNVRGPNRYSDRNAVFGSTRVARSAGAAAAKSATTSMIALTVA